MKQLSGKRILLRQLTVSDSKQVLVWGRDPLYQKLAGFNGISSKKAAEFYVQHAGAWGIAVKETNQLIGLVELKKRGSDPRSGLDQTREVGFLLDRPFWRQGYMSEALQLVLDYAFNELALTEVWAGTLPGNVPSQALLAKFGFNYVYTASLPSFLGAGSSERYYLLKKEDWQQEVLQK
jgi:ribosomal-protein-alanine N-acetyltransferase